MGLSPAEVLAMPLYDYQAALYHFNLAQDGQDDEDEPLGADEFDEMRIALTASGMIN